MARLGKREPEISQGYLDINEIILLAMEVRDEVDLSYDTMRMKVAKILELAHAVELEL